MILGSGPNRIGQGIEFDYCCCHASFALQELGYESIMVNCNPETVSTDYDTSDRLYFEPLTLEHVLNIFDTERPDGVIVQFGGQTPLTLALPLKRQGVPIIGTDPEDIDLAEDRKLFGKLLDDLGIPAPENGSATSAEEACAIARRIGYPVLVRPSYVLGGRAMVIAYDEDTVREYMREAVTFSQDRPVLIDRFLEDATEVDVDALSDGEEVLIAGIMEHIEEAGVHSGDSSCVLPAQSIPRAQLDTIEDYTVRLAKALHVIGLMNVQYAIQNGTVYVLEVNPRASRTVPYVSKATGVPLPKIAVGLMLGKKIRDFTDATRRAAGAAGIREIAGVSVQQISGRGPGAGAGDALDGRGDGGGRELRRSLRQGADQRGHAAAGQGHRVHQRERASQAGGRGGGAQVRGARIPAGGHARYGGGAARGRAGLQDRVQGERRPSQCGGSAEGGFHSTGGVHDGRRAGVFR